MLPLALAPGCTDDFFGPEENNTGNNPDVITFSAVTAGASVSTRSDAEKTLYEPLELTDGSASTTLYLHTYDAERIGYQPGEETVSGNKTDGVHTRGMQVVSAQDLKDFHKSFQVHAEYKDSREEYIEWCETQVSSAINFWRTAETRYWPGEKMLSFHAVSPASEFSSLQNRGHDSNTISFSYTAKKGAANKDAEAQKDLLMAIGSCNKPGSENGRAPLLFHHALSAVKFAVRDVLDGEVVNIKINNVHSSGNCVYTVADDSTGEGSFTWSGVESSAKEIYSQNFNYAINNRPVVDPSDDSQDLVMNETMPEKTFMLIPQQIPDDAEIIVTLRRTNPGNDENGNPLPKEITVRGKIKANNVTEWLPGHEYIYTISTSKDNWVYVFDALGNEAEGYENIYVYSPGDTRFDTYKNTAYYSVRSYRYRANDQSRIEACPWKASHDGSYSYNVEGNNETLYPSGNPELRWVSSSTWITDNFKTPLKGEGNVDKSYERHNLDFLAHYVTTNWIGDENMQGYKPYPDHDKSKPYDLSKQGGEARNTANCYIVDRGGWYMFPMVYGNAIKNGATNTSAYTCQNTSTDAKLLKNMVDYQGKAISSPNISVPANAKAELVWEDAYSLVEDIELVTINGEKMIRFYIEPNNIQQGNAIIALTDGSKGTAGESTIIWSWQIWATEHWIDKKTRKSHAFDTENATFNTYTPSAVKTEDGVLIGRRQCGDVAVTHNQHNHTFMMAPYNLGWCDPKKVLYLKRKGNMKFVQYRPDGSLSGKTDELPIIQNGETIDYKYANTSYYQWGRKDPMPGFYNHANSTKRVFGYRLPEKQKDKAINIQDAIKNPNVYYCSAEAPGSKFEDWLSTNFKSNLWNNHASSSMTARDDANYHEDMWCHIKTIYDPSPAGYMVPNAGVWHVIQKAHSSQWTDVNGKVYTKVYYNKKDGKYYGDQNPYTIVVEKRDTWAGGNWTLNMFNNKINGAAIDAFNYKIWGQGKADDSQALFFGSTGNRWWSDGHPAGNNYKAGDNFNKNISYAWSNRPSNGNNSYGMALGLDADRESIENVNDKDLRYYVGAQFIGRRTMARPVRCIREY